MASQPTVTPAAPDVQASVPETQVSLSRVGVTGVEKVIRVKADGSENLFYAGFECFVDLNPQQAGVHMSRFEEIVGEAIDEVVLGQAFKAEVLAAHVAEKVRERQHGRRAEVSLTARYPEIVHTPESDIETQEIYVLFGTAVASEAGTRTLTGVQAQGMTACPCAQEMVTGLSRERLAEHDRVDRLADDFLEARHVDAGLARVEVDEALEVGVVEVLLAVGLDPDHLLDPGHADPREADLGRRHPGLHVGRRREGRRINGHRTMKGSDLPILPPGRSVGVGPPWEGRGLYRR